MKKQNQKLHIPYASKLDMVLYAVLGCLGIALLIALTKFTTVDITVWAFLITAAYIGAVTYIYYRRAKRSMIYSEETIHSLLDEEGSIVLKNTKSPTVAINDRGLILWYNDAMRSILDSSENYIGNDIATIVDIDEAQYTAKGRKVTIGEFTYEVEGFELSKSAGGLYVLVFSDVTTLLETQKKYEDERTVVCYISIDNIEDVLRYVHEKFSEEISRVDDKLKEWARSVNGILKSYDNDKYILMFDSVYLDECIKNRFSILDTIRDTRVGDGVAITVSIGVSRKLGTLAERELDAKDALDMALQRGGDQAVYKSEEGTEFYGGRTKTVYKRSNVRSRVFANALSALMVRADNIIVMGHRYGDFDSLAASVGVARLAFMSGTKVNIAVDLRDKNLRPCIDLLQTSEVYSQVFVDNAEGLDLIGPDTLVVLVDHNTVSRAQFSDIAAKASSVVIIDHHRKIDGGAGDVRLSYIDPSASSTSEIVTEMLESVVSSQNLIKEEADLLLAGILLDTKQFTRNTGTRTFGAAQYLRGAGADPTDVYDLFKAAPEDLSKEARFHTAITVYKKNIAISCCESEADETYHIIASKAADKMLTLKGVDAAFTLVKIGKRVHISGRSTGKVNVQLILERLNGGGHFDVAGAQVVAESVLEVLEQLKESIDAYLEINS